MDILEIGGEVETPKKFDFTSLHSLPNQIENVSEVLPGKEGAAVSLQSILDHVGATGAARAPTAGPGECCQKGSTPHLGRQTRIQVRQEGRIVRVGEHRIRPVRIDHRTSPNAPSALPGGIPGSCDAPSPRDAGHCTFYGHDCRVSRGNRSRILRHA